MNFIKAYCEFYTFFAGRMSGIAGFITKILLSIGLFLTIGVLIIDNNLSLLLFLLTFMVLSGFIRSKLIKVTFFISEILNKKINGYIVYVFLYSIISAVWLGVVLYLVNYLFSYREINLSFIDVTINYGLLEFFIVVLIGYQILLFAFSFFESFSKEVLSYSLLQSCNVLFMQIGYFIIIVSVYYNRFYLGIIIASLFFVSFVLYLIFRELMDLWYTLNGINIRKDRDELFRFSNLTDEERLAEIRNKTNTNL